MGTDQLFDPLFDSAILSLPMLALYLWAWVRSRRLSALSVRHGRRFRALLLTLVALLYAEPLAVGAFLACGPSPEGESMARWQLAVSGIQLLFSGLQALCWYALLRLLLDLTVQARSSPTEG